MRSKIVIKSVVFTFVISGAFVKPAFAYIDPNTGGQLFQLLAVLFASLSAILLFFSSQIRMALNRFRRFLRELSNKTTNEPEK